MAISSLVRTCGSKKIMGVKAKIYGIPKGDITTFATASASAEYGDDKVLDTAFVLAATKFWLEYDILVNTAEVINTMTGETGGRAIQQSLPFFLDQFDKGARKLMDDLIAYDGCMIFGVPEKGGNASIIGDLENPCFIEEMTGSTGGPDNARRGVAFRLIADTGYSSPIYTGAFPTS